VREIAEITGISHPRCQLILTQLVMAELVEESAADSCKFRRYR